jgi:hypothetical protein
VHEVTDDDHVDFASLGLGFDAGYLVVVAVDQGHPSPFMAWVAPAGLVEDLGEHHGGSSATLADR